MKTLEEAWKWYRDTKSQVRLINRLAAEYRDELPWVGRLDRDDQFKAVKPEKLTADTTFNWEQIDDLAVLVLFSVFESIVRELLVAEIEEEIEEKGIDHAILLRSFKDIIQQVGEGSFYRVLEPSKSLDPNLVEEVNQVRRYRNWVAHGKRGTHPDNVSPVTAYKRLTQFSDLLAAQSLGKADARLPTDD